MIEKILIDVKVLCVDDCDSTLTLLTKILEHYGADVTACLTAELALIEIRTKKFDVILSDLNMPPGMDGYDLAHAVRSQEKDGNRNTTPMMMVSSDANTSSPKRRFADFQVYMTKPFNQKNIVSIVNRLAEADGGAVLAGSLSAWERSLPVLPSCA